MKGLWTSILSLSAIVIASSSSAQVTVGVYWDPAYTESILTTETFPSVHPGFVVFHDPSGTEGVSGYEYCAGIEGPALFLSWDLEGETFNIASPPCFQLGISPDPLPPATTILLATFQIMVTEDLPVTLSMTPVSNPTLNNQLSYNPAGDPGEYRPLITVPGTPEVAWINNDQAFLSVSPTNVYFPATNLGYPYVEVVTLTNEGYQEAIVPVTFSDPAGPFSLVSPTSPVTVPLRSSVDLQVTFDPLVGGFQSGVMNLGPDVPQVLLQGQAIQGNLAWDAPDTMQFPDTIPGRLERMDVVVTNTGGVEFPILPSIETPCGPFRLALNYGTSNLQPGETLSIPVNFEPPNQGEFTCVLDLGHVLPDVILTGTGCLDCGELSVVDMVDFGSVGVGNTGQQVLTVYNVGSVPVLVEASLPANCPEFSIVAGGGPVILNPGLSWSIGLAFSPADLGYSTCTLGLGTGNPSVQLAGTGRDPLIDWSVPHSLVFGEIGIGSSHTHTFDVINTGDLPFVIDPQVPPECPEFQLIGGGGVFELIPGASRSITVTFSPAALDTFTCDLDLGAVVPPIPMYGFGVPGVHQYELTIPVIPPTAVGGLSTASLLIQNTGSLPLPVDIDRDPDCLYFSLSTTPFEVAVGETRHLPVTFRPLEPGLFSCLLNMGSIIPPITIEAEAFPAPGSWLVEPTSYDFPTQWTGDDDSEYIDVTNTGGTNIEMFVTLESPSNAFTLSYGGAGPYTLRPGYNKSYRVRFAPLVAGPDSATLHLGAGIPPVPITGFANLSVWSCTVTPAALDFGVVDIGDTASIPYTVTVGGNRDIRVYGVPSTPQFTVAERSVTLQPGESTDFTVTFAPQTIGLHEAEIRTSNEHCSSIPVQGVGRGEFALDENRIGMYFDGAHSLPEFHTTATPEVVTGYLVLKNPSLETGVAAWECSYGLEGNGLFLGWQFEGQVVNAGTAPSLIVGIGGPPLPHANSVLLATFQVLVHYAGQPVDLLLRPAYPPSLPGFMCWIPAEQSGLLVPMLPSWDDPVVAWINRQVVEVPPELPQTTRLLPNVPNPFNPSTRIDFELAAPARVRLAIYDVTGRRVTVLADEEFPAGPVSRTWTGRDDSGRQVPSGPYFVRMVTDKGHFTRKIMLLR